MKKLVLLLFFLLSFSKFCYSQGEISHHVYYIEWDGEWGRTSKDCQGWGLCNFKSCWFCCELNGCIIDCSSNEKMYGAGIVEINPKDNTGFLIIQLSPDNEAEKKAISNNEILYVDEDIVNCDVTLLKGEYSFDKSIGKYGGYQVKAKETVNK
jgi:hypothetical protein